MIKEIHNHHILISTGDNPNLFEEYNCQMFAIDGIVTINGLFDRALDVGNSNTRNYEISTDTKSFFDELSKMSLLNYVDNITCPVLIIHEINNEETNVIQSEAFFTAIKDRCPNTPCELLLLNRNLNKASAADFIEKRIDKFANDLLLDPDEKNKDEINRYKDQNAKLYLSYTSFPFKRDSEFGYAKSKQAPKQNGVDFYNFRLPDQEHSDHVLAYDGLYFAYPECGDIALYYVNFSELTTYIEDDKLKFDSLIADFSTGQELKAKTIKLSSKYDNFYDLSVKKDILYAWYSRYDNPSIKVELDKYGKIVNTVDSIDKHGILDDLLNDTHYTLHIEEIHTDTAQGWLLYDESFKPDQSYPLLTVVHGGPNGFYCTAYSDEFRYYIENGYMVLFTNPRGGDGYDKEHNDPEHAWNGDFLNDIEEIIDAAVQRFTFIDKSRIGITGGSYGGYAVIYALENSNTFKCGCALRPFANFHMIGSCSQSAGGQAKKEDYDSYLNYLLECNENSLVSYADRISTALLLIQSENDANCIPQQMKQLQYVLSKLGKKSNLLMLPNSNHSLMSKGPKEQAQIAYRAIIEFFDNNLK